jgi:hypothetical protein
VPRRLVRKKKSLLHVNGVVEACYCRKCCKTKPVGEFYLATDKLLDTNGYLSICKECVSDIYVGFYNSEHSLDRAIYRVCQALNIIYIEEAVGAVRTQLGNQERLEDDKKIFGIYKTKIVAAMKGVGIATMQKTAVMDFTFQPDASIPEYSQEEHNFEGSEGVMERWGDQYSADDYRFLEQEFANFKHTHKADTYAEVVLLKEVCYKLLDIKKKRELGTSTSAPTKELQELMKSLAISPNATNQASGGKSLECFGKWIEEIENFKPAEYFADKDIYKDVDNIEAYGEKYITTPLRSFVLQSSEFGTEELEKMLDEEAQTEG